MPKILGIRLDNRNLQEATKAILQWAKGKKQFQVSTPNPEILLAAQKNPEFAEVLNNSKLNIPDGVGLLWAAKFQASTKNQPQIIKYLKLPLTLLSTLNKKSFKNAPLQERVTGSDLMKEICQKSTEKIFLLGAAPGIAEEAAKKLGPQIVGTHSGSPKPEHEKEIITKINRVKPTILFVAYGAPAQELWIAHNLSKMPTVKVAIGVGGSFDFIAGKVKRAPITMQKIGLEWLWRLIQEPKRLKRIINAIIIFPLTILRENT